MRSPILLVLAASVVFANVQDKSSETLSLDAKAVEGLHLTKLMRRTPTNGAAPSPSSPQPAAAAAAAAPATAPVAGQPSRKRKGQPLSGAQKRNRRMIEQNARGTDSDRSVSPDDADVRRDNPARIRADMIAGPAKITVKKGAYTDFSRKVYRLKDETETLERKEWTHPNKVQVDVKTRPGGKAELHGNARRVWSKSREGQAVQETWSPTSERRKGSKNGVAKAKSESIERPAYLDYYQEGPGRGSIIATNSKSYSPERSPGDDPEAFPPQMRAKKPRLAMQG